MRSGEPVGQVRIGQGRVGVSDAVTPQLAGTFDHGAQGRVTERPCLRQVEFDRQRIGRAARPASIGCAPASPENLHCIVVVEVRDYQRFAPCARSRQQTSQIACIARFGRRRQRQPLHDRVTAPVAPVIEQVIGGGVVARKRRLTPASGVGAAYGENDGLRRLFPSLAAACIRGFVCPASSSPRAVWLHRRPCTARHIVAPDREGAG